MAPVRKGSFVCDVCQKHFAQKVSLKRHKAMHEDHRPYVCDVCPRTFRRPDILQQHQKVHQPKKSAKCPSCRRFFTHVRNLKAHLLKCSFALAGNGENEDHHPYVCEVCTMAFRLPHVLQQHQKVHQSKKSAKCPYCSRFVTHARDLKPHLTKCSFAPAVNGENAPNAHDSSESDTLSDTSEELTALEVNNNQEHANANADSGDDATLLGSDDEEYDAEFGPFEEAHAVDDAMDIDAPLEKDHHEDATDGTDSDGGDHLAPLPTVAFRRYRSQPSVSSRASSVDRSMLFCSDDRDEGVPPADGAAASAASLTGLEELFGCVSVRFRLPLVHLREAFAFLRREDMIAASLARRCFRNLVQTFGPGAAPLRHFAHMVIEPAVAGQRFGTRDHGWRIPSKTCTVLWCEMGHDRTRGVYKCFSSVPSAIDYVVNKKLLSNAYVEDFTLRQRLSSSTAAVPSTLWTKLGDAMQTAAIDQWTLDGLSGMDTVARFGDILAPFRAVKKLRALAVRRCVELSNPALQGFINECCPGIRWT